MLLHTHTHPLNGPLSETTQVSRYQKGKTNLDFTEARDSEWQWHPLGHMQVCILHQTDNHANTPPHALPVAQPTASKHYAASVTGKNRLWYLLTLAPGYGATEFTAHNWKARSSYSCIWVSLLLGRIAYIECKDVAHCYRYSMVFLYVCLQCFDAVGWAAGRASSL